MENQYGYVLKTQKTVADVLPTLTANQYDYYKTDDMPVSKTIINRTGCTWNEVLNQVGLPCPLDRQTLAKLSNFLHRIEKNLKEVMGIGWVEKTFRLEGKILRPDSYFVERELVDDERFFILDVKLCISAAPITIYKYLPLFENRQKSKSMRQTTFFEEWLPQRCTEKPLVHYDKDGQSDLAIINNVLYISYLIGKPRSDILPSSTIRGKNTSTKKKLPHNMEVRYIDFTKLPSLYCDLAGIKFESNKVDHLMRCAKEIKDIITSLPTNIETRIAEIEKIL